MKRMLLSFFGTGYLRPAPGTWGSLAAIPAAWVLVSLGGPVLLGIAIIGGYLAGVAALRSEVSETGDHDPSWVVIDEVVGQWIALLPVAVGAWVSGASVLALWPGILAAFLLFRLFDIWKPGVIGTADERNDATGVMLDDAWAGLFAATCVIALAVFAHSGLISAATGTP